MELVDENRLKQRISEWGADIVGFADLREVLPKELSHLPVAVSIGVRLSDQIIRGIKNGPTMLYAYNVSITNSLLNEIALRASNYLQNSGFDAILIPAAQSSKKSKILFQHKTAATCAGIGWIGKSSLLIHPKNGPQLRLVTVLTDAPVTHYGKPVRESRCGSCKSCVDACPVGAIKGTNWKRGVNVHEYFDLEKCQEYIDKEGLLLDKPVCGICISACHVGLHK
ncbi:MAG: epoxyqueuosine reductase [Theionarchaea archaeon]|nr:epoxyqueuosine reductase [Theionarchaea archaeon]